MKRALAVLLLSGCAAVPAPLVIDGSPWGASSQGLRVPAVDALTCQQVRAADGQGVRAYICERI